MNNNARFERIGIWKGRETVARDNTVYRGTRLRVTFNDPPLPRGGAPSREGRGEGRAADRRPRARFSLRCSCKERLARVRANNATFFAANVNVPVKRANKSEEIYGGENRRSRLYIYNWIPRFRLRRFFNLRSKKRRWAERFAERYHRTCNHGLEKWEEAASRTADIDRVSIVSFERARRIVYIAGTILARKEGRKEGTTGDELGALRSMNYAKSNYISCYTSGKVPLYISQRRRRRRVDERI